MLIVVGIVTFILLAVITFVGLLVMSFMFGPMTRARPAGDKWIVEELVDGEWKWINKEMYDTYQEAKKHL